MIFNKTKFGKSLVCNSSKAAWVRFLLNLTNSVGIEVRCNDSWSNLRYLEAIPQLHIFSLGMGLSLDTFEGLESQSHLKSLTLGLRSKSKINWEGFQDLRKVFCEGNFVGESLWNLPLLDDLTISSCSEDGWINISHLKSLERIEVIRGGMNDFKNLESPSLRHIEVHLNRNFNSLKNSSNVSNVEELHITYCGKLQSLSGVGEFPKLKKLAIEDCGEIESLRPLLGLGMLEEIDLCGTTVSDGCIKELLTLESLKTINFNDRKNYDIKLIDCLLELGVPQTDWPFMLREPKKWARMT